MEIFENEKMGQPCPTFTNYNVMQFKICGYASFSWIAP
jgi:hypothetical protein